MFKKQFEFHPEGSFVTWLVTIIVQAFHKTDLAQRKTTIVAVQQEHGARVHEITYALYVDDINELIGANLETWYNEHVEETRPRTVEEALASMHTTGEDPRYYQLTGVPRSLRDDYDFPCVPGSPGYAYL